MKKIRLVLVDDDVTFIRRAEEYLRGTQEIEVIGCADDGLSASNLISREKPDAIVMDFVLRRLNSLSLLRSIHELAPSPIVIVCSAFLSETALTMARRLGVDFFVGKPVSLPHLYECIVDMVSVKHRLVEEANSVQAMNAPVTATAAVHRALISSGISPRLSGFSFLAEGLQLLLSDQNLLKNMSQRLYPKIAHAMETTPDNVERNIRSAIQGSVKRNAGKNCSNRQFITILIHKVQEEQRTGLT